MTKTTKRFSTRLVAVFIALIMIVSPVIAQAAIITDNASYDTYYEAITPLGQVLVKPFPCDPNYCTRFYKQDAEISCDCTNPDAAHMLMNAHWGIDGESIIARTFPKNWVFICDTFLNEPNPPAQRRVYILWPIIPGFTLEVIAKYNQARINQWEDLFPQFSPLGTATYRHPDRLSRNLDSHFYMSAPGVTGHLTNHIFHLIANVRTRATTVQLQTQNLHLNYESGQESVGLRTPAVAGVYDINDIANYFTHNAHIENRTFSAPAFNFTNDTWMPGFPQSVAPLTLKIPALPNGERAFEFYFECPDTPGTWIQSYDFTTGVLGGWNEGYHLGGYIFDSLPIRPKADLPAGVHQTDVRIYQYGWVWSGTQPAFGSPPDYMPTLRYVWLGAVPIPGSNHVLLNPDNGQFRVTFEVDPCPHTPDGPIVEITKEAANSYTPFLVGETITYTITVANTGPGTALGVVVTDELPAEVEFVSSSSNMTGVNFNHSAGVLTANVGNLPASDSVIFTVVVRAIAETAANEYATNTATATGGNFTEVTTEEDVTINTTIVTTDPVVTITKANDATSSLLYGDTVIYTITVENEGPGVATNVVVTDQLPLGLNFVDAKIVSDPANAQINFNQINKTLTVTVPTLAVDGVVVIELEVTVNRKEEGSITNIAGLTVDGTPSGYDDSTITVVPEDAPVVTIEKTAADNDTQFNVGDKITYTITVTNPNDFALYNFVVVDQLDRNLVTFVSGSVSTAVYHSSQSVAAVVYNDYKFDDTTYELRVTLYELPANGGKIVITFDVTVTAAAAGQTVRNIATIEDRGIVVGEDYEDVRIRPRDRDRDPGGPGGGGGGGNGGGTDPGDNNNVTEPPDEPVLGPRDPNFVVVFSPEHHAYLIGYPAEVRPIRPQGNITRAEVVTIFFRLLDDNYRTQMWSQTNPFNDVVLTNWFNNAISTMANANLIEGYPDGSFRPNQAITRAEFVTIISRFVENPGYEGANIFNDISGHWAQEAINIAGYFGWIEGYGDGTFRPNQAITRAEAAAIVNRLLNRLPESVEDLLPGMIIWPDNMNQNAWYYLHIQEATNSHRYVRKADGIHETWTELKEPRMWEVLERPGSRPQDILN